MMTESEKALVFMAVVAFLFGIGLGMLLCKNFGVIQTDTPAKIDYAIEVIDGKVDTTFIYKHP